MAQEIWGSTGPPLLWYFGLQKMRDHVGQQCIVTAKGRDPETIIITGLIDSGAHVIVISQLFWPSSWPLIRADFGVVGLSDVNMGGLSVTNVRHPEGQQANIRPYVTSGPYNLWG